MAEPNGANGHAPDLEAPIETATDAELDALLAGMFEPRSHEIAPGRWIEIRPLLLKNADRLYLGTMAGADLQRFLLSRCVFVAGKVLGELGADRLPVGIAGKLVPIVMAANGMAIGAEEGEGEAPPADPKPSGASGA